MVINKYKNNTIAYPEEETQKRKLNLQPLPLSRKNVELLENMSSNS